MKKNICLLALGVLLALIFTACDNGNSAQTLTNEIEETELNNESSDSEYDEGTLEDFFNNPMNAYLLSELNSSFDETDESYKSVYKDSKISFRKNRLIYEFYFVDNYGDMQNSVEPSLKSGASRMFETLRKFFNPKDKMEIEIIYYNNDGSIAADVVTVEEEDTENITYESDAEPGTVEYYYETYFGPDYWDNMASSTKDETEGIYSEIEIQIDGNNLKYIYYLVSNVGDVQDIMAEEFTEEYMNYCVDQLKCPSEIKGTVYMEYIFYNPDGTIAAQFSAQG